MLRPIQDMNETTISAIDNKTFWIKIAQYWNQTLDLMNKREIEQGKKFFPRKLNMN